MGPLKGKGVVMHSLFLSLNGETPGFSWLPALVMVIQSALWCVSSTMETPAAFRAVGSGHPVWLDFSHPCAEGDTDTALTHYDFSSCSCNSLRRSYSGMQGVCCYLRSCKLGESPCASQIYSLLTSMYVNRFWPQGLDMVKIFLPAWCRLDE